MSIPSGSIVGNYLIIEKLGSGGMADVYIGEHIEIKKRVAIKIMHAQLADEKRKAQFKLEAKTIAYFEHPHIVPIFDYGFSTNGLPYIVMPIAKTSLAAVTKGKVLSLETALEYAVPIAQALQYIHMSGEKLVHRDVKPENILISQTDTLLLADFGIAVGTTSDPDLDNVRRDIAGSLPYMPLEQFDGKPQRSTDQYALAVIMYTWLCGARPFIGNFGNQTEAWFGYMSLHMNKPVPSFVESGGKADPEIEAVLKRALAKKPDDRYETILDFVNGLEAIRTNRIHEAQEARARAQRRQEEEEKQRARELITRLKRERDNAYRHMDEQDNQFSREREELLTQINTSNNAMVDLKETLGTQLVEIDRITALHEATVKKLALLEEANNQFASLVKSLEKEKIGLLEEIQRAQQQAAGKQAQKKIADGEKPTVYTQPLQKEEGDTPAINTNSSRETELDYLRKAFRFHKESSYEEALAAYDQLLLLDPNDALAHYGRGDVLYMLERYEEALVACDQVLQLNPTYVNAHSLRGCVLNELERYEQALVAYDQVLQLNPTHVNAHIGRGFALSHLEKYEEALVACDQALQLDPTHVDAHFDRGCVLLLLKRYEEALAAYDQILQLDPTHEAAREGKKLALEQLGR